jgi:hypothetical protein
VPFTFEGSRARRGGRRPRPPREEKVSGSCETLRPGPSNVASLDRLLHSRPTNGHAIRHCDVHPLQDEEPVVLIQGEARQG